MWLEYIEWTLKQQQQQQCVHDEQSVSLPSPYIFYIVRVVLFPSFHFILFGISVSIYSRRRFIVVARALDAHRLLFYKSLLAFILFLLLLYLQFLRSMFRSLSLSREISLIFGSTVSRRFFLLLFFIIIFSFFNTVTLSDAPIQCLPFVDTHPIE